MLIFHVLAGLCFACAFINLATDHPGWAVYMFVCGFAQLGIGLLKSREREK